MTSKTLRALLSTSLALIFALSACSPASPSLSDLAATLAAPLPANTATHPTPQAYAPGEPVDYVAQSGDTLAALAARFNTSVDEILQMNSFIPRDATTMPPGMPMKIPIYYRALWGGPFQIIPDSAFVNGPNDVGFNTSAFLSTQPGWFGTYRAYIGGEWKDGAALADYVAMNYSVSPKLLLALLEYQSGALTKAEAPTRKNLLGFDRPFWDSPYLQLVQAANILNNGYYGWRAGALLEFEDPAAMLIRPNPWQNAATVALQYYYSRIFKGDALHRAVGEDGLYKTYVAFFGDPWQGNTELIPGSLAQPEISLPFPQDQTWSFTGGPHTGWGTGEPLSALDFAPPADRSGCVAAKRENFAVAAANGLIVRSGVDGVALDLDLDGDERTGWVIFYLHLAADGRAALGEYLHAGDKIGYPSCEGGRATGTHVHIARKYNGEWILADSATPFTLSGWKVRAGSAAYKGVLVKSGATVIACECGDAYAAINANYP
ncbi:MAG: LysM peptidoglycan-binding domain-containing protein [Anaerolineales bacterium]|nr:LysM peptidoglycan-binding domain-containing protein [Anaerolineales bacterium]